jgi:hypothetical protein
VQAFRAQRIADDAGLPVAIEGVARMLQGAAAAQGIMRARRYTPVRRGFDDANDIAAQHAINIAAKPGLEAIARQRAIDIDALALTVVNALAFRTQRIDQKLIGHCP